MNNKIIITIIIVLLIITLGLSGIGIYYSINQSNNNGVDNNSSSNSSTSESEVSSLQESNVSTIDSSSSSSTQLDTPSSSTMSEEEKLTQEGCKIVENYLKSYLTSSNDREKINDYKITKCDYLEKVNPPVTPAPENTFYVYVEYDVVPRDINNTIWYNQNIAPAYPEMFQIKDGWVTKCFHLFNIKIENGEYKYNYETKGY